MVSTLTCVPVGTGSAQSGVCLRLKIGPHKILLDCGLSDPSDLLAGAEAQPAEPPADFVFCSHAHSDHAQGLRWLRQTYPHLPIYGSEVTSQLLHLNWPEQPVLPDLCQALPWYTPVEVLEGLTVQLFPAGHLPGAACILLRYSAADRPYTVFYTGDFFLSNSRLVDGLSLEPLRRLQPDLLILEGSYGTERIPIAVSRKIIWLQPCKLSYSRGGPCCCPRLPWVWGRSW